MLIACPECGKSKVSDKALACPECGFPIAATIIPTIPVQECKKTRSPRKRRKLPNGFGSVKKLSGKRKKPYAAYPPVTEFNLNGSPVSVPAIGYFVDWQSAFNALSDYNKNPYDLSNNNITFAELYELYYKAKYVDNKKKVFSEASKNSTKAAFKNCSILHSKAFKELRKPDLQNCLDSCKLKHSSLELIVSLYHQLYKYALENEIVEKDFSQFVVINTADDDVSGVPFTDLEIKKLWENVNLPYVDTILIYIYSGFRISEFLNIEINLEEKYFKGGVKTSAGKNRIVPIHPAIFPLVEKYDGKTFLTISTSTYRKHFTAALENLDMIFTSTGLKHTPHDCRHTFSWLCDKYKVDSLSKHMLMGHAVKGDVEASVYGHRTFEELTAEIGKIKV